MYCDFIRRVTITHFRFISALAGFRRHLVGKTLRNYVTATSLDYALLFTNKFNLFE